VCLSCLISAEQNLNQKIYENDYFIIHYSRKDHLTGSKAQDHLRDAYKNISRDFDHQPKDKIQVVLFARDEYQQIADSIPHWMVATFDGSEIQIPIYKRAGIKLRKSVFHELTHAFIWDLAGLYNCPAWLNEGLAQIQEFKVRPDSLRTLIDAVHKNKLMDLDQFFSKGILGKLSEDEAKLFYLQAFSFVSFLIQKKGGYDPIKLLLLDLNKSTPFSQAFETVYHQSLHAMANEWQQDVKQRYETTSCRLFISLCQ
jgi:hypothetical protein